MFVGQSDGLVLDDYVFEYFEALLHGLVVFLDRLGNLLFEFLFGLGLLAELEPFLEEFDVPEMEVVQGLALVLFAELSGAPDGREGPSCGVGCGGLG